MTTGWRCAPSPSEATPCSTSSCRTTAARGKCRRRSGRHRGWTPISFVRRIIELGDTYEGGHSIVQCARACQMQSFEWRRVTLGGPVGACRCTPAGLGSSTLGSSPRRRSSMSFGAVGSRHSLARHVSLGRCDLRARNSCRKRHEGGRRAPTTSLLGTPAPLGSRSVTDLRQSAIPAGRSGWPATPRRAAEPRFARHRSTHSWIASTTRAGSPTTARRRELENAIAALAGVRHCVAMCNATSLWRSRSAPPA